MKKLDANLITREFFPESVDNPRAINCGLCCDWAYIAYRLFDGIELWSNEEHAFIKYNGKYYDSESPDGVKKWQDLKCNKYIIKYMGVNLNSHRETLDEFFIDWKENNVKKQNRRIENYLKENKMFDLQENVGG